MLFNLRLRLYNNLESLEKSQKWVETQPKTIFSVVKKCFGELVDTLKFMFDLSLEKRIFRDDSKIVRFNPAFIVGDCSKL